MLMCYGLFVFSVHTAPFDSVQRSTEWRWPSNNRTGGEPAYQFIGRGEDQITLNGVLMPAYTGGPSSLNMLREMAERGEPHLTKLRANSSSTVTRSASNSSWR